MSVIAERLHVLEDVRLTSGSHSPDSGEMCAMEMVAFLAGEDWTDHPACVSPVLAGFLRQWNDDLDDEGRQMLKPLLPRTIGTAGDGHDELRGWLCADWLVRVHTPAWLELAGIGDAAAALRSLPALRDMQTLAAAQPAIDQARAAGAAARAAARDAAWDAAWAAARAAARDAARAAARAAARDAARAAAWAAARAAAWDAARAAAWDAAWDAAWAAAGAAAGAAARAAAWAAAWDAAWDAARAAAGAAAGDAARAAAWDALRPTAVELQRSALELVELLIDPVGSEA